MKPTEPRTEDCPLIVALQHRQDADYHPLAIWYRESLDETRALGREIEAHKTAAVALARKQQEEFARQAVRIAELEKELSNVR